MTEKTLNEEALSHLDKMEKILKDLKNIVHEAEQYLNRRDIQEHLFDIEQEIVTLETLIEKNT